MTIFLKYRTPLLIMILSFRLEEVLFSIITIKSFQGRQFHSLKSYKSDLIVRYKKLEDRAALMKNVMELLEITRHHAQSFAAFDVRAAFQAVPPGSPAPTLPVTLCTLLKLCLKTYHALIQVCSCPCYCLKQLRTNYYREQS